MKFPSAFSGVKKLFAAEILQIIAVIAMGVAGILAGVLAVVMQNNGGDLDDAAGTIGASFGMLIAMAAGMIILIVAAVFKIIGLVKAGKDDVNFKYALIMILVAFAASVTSSFFQNNNALLYQIFDIVFRVADLLSTIFVIQGIMSLAANLGDSEMVAKGATIFKTIIGIYVFSILGATTYAILYPFPFLRVFGVVLLCFSLLLEVISYVLFISYLSKAKKMLG